MIKTINLKNGDISWSTDKENRSKHFDLPIDKFISSLDKIFLLFKDNVDLGNRNIFCLDESGRTLWQVQDPDTMQNNKNRTKSPFNWIQMKGDVLSAFNFDSHEYDIDINSGRILRSTWKK